jgi:hypothetical protein
MKRLPTLILLTGMLAVSGGAMAQQSEDFANHEVHYNALNSSLISPQVAQAYGIRRSSSSALLTITIMKKEEGTFGTPIRAKVKASGINLTGQRRTIDMREASDSGGAVYYLGELPIRNMELYNFTVEMEVEGEKRPLVVKFRKQFYTE